MDIAVWLRDLGLERYELAFREDEIEWEALPKLTAEGHVRQAGGDSRLKEAEAPRVQRRWWKANRRSMRWQGARSTAWRIVLRPQRRYQALRLWRTAARLRGLTAALRPSFWHPCRSTAQWIA